MATMYLLLRCLCALLGLVAERWRSLHHMLPRGHLGQEETLALAPPGGCEGA